MGARTVVSGMSAETALTLQTMGLELAGVQTVLSLEQALELRGVTRDRARDVVG
jgi:rsbT antagonist protein RsbS